MHVPSASISFLLSCSVVAQCSVGAPAFVVDCPCSFNPSPLLSMVGTARIGTFQRLEALAGANCILPSILLVGPPPAFPLPLPTGLVACRTTMAPVTTLRVDPAIVALLNPELSASPCPGRFQPYFLFIPSDPAFVGLTVRAQFFERVDGVSSVPFLPFYASPAIGFTVAP